MALDPNIILAAAPSQGQMQGPPDIAKIYAQATAIKQAQEQQQTSNALKAVFTDPTSVDDQGLPTPNALKRITALNPQMGMKLYDNLATLKVGQEQADAAKGEMIAKKSQYYADTVLIPAQTAYNDTLKSTGNKAAAVEAGQRALSEGRDQVAKAGWHSDEELSGHETTFDPGKVESQLSRFKDWRAERHEQAGEDHQAAQEKEASRRADLAEKHESEQIGLERQRVGLEGARLSMERDKQRSDLGDAAIQMAAEQVLAGDPAALRNLGRGAQGSADLSAIRGRVATLAAQRGISGADLANIDAEFKGQQAGESYLGRRGAQLSQAGAALDKLIDQSKDVYAKLPRGQLVPFNELQRRVASGTSSPEQAASFAADQAVINQWAKAINPTGTLTVEATRKGGEMLSNATSHEAHDRVLEQMRKEIGAEKVSIPAARSDVRRDPTGPAPAAGAPKRLKWDPATGKLEPVS